MTVVDYISQMGGLLGLFIGFSFISGIELVYWMTIRMGRNVQRKTVAKMDVTTKSHASWAK